MKIANLLITLSVIFSALNIQAEEENPCSGMNHPAHQDEYKLCLKKEIYIKLKEGDVDCATCVMDIEPPMETTWMHALASAIVPGAGMLASIAGAKYQNKLQEQAAQNYAAGFSACTNQFNSALNNNIASGYNPILPAAATQMSMMCNSYPYTQYAGYGGSLFGMDNPLVNGTYATGFSTGFSGSFTTGTITNLDGTSSGLSSNSLSSAAAGISDVSIGTSSLTAPTSSATGFGF